MTKKSELLWYESHTRQAPVAILMIIFNVLKSLIRTWWPFILILIFRSDFIRPETVKWWVGVITFIVILISVWRYFRFYFFLSEDKLHVFKGVFTRVKLDIPFDRIQSITFEQNIIHQLFKVARVKVDTAGSSSEEFEFAALDLKKADQLRAFILSRKTSNIADDVTEQKTSGRLLLNLEISDLLKVGISQNHFRTTGIVVAFLLGLRDRIKEALGDRYLNEFDSLTEQLFENIVVYGLGLFITILILSFFGTLIYSVLKYYDFKLWKSKDGYRMESGLFNRREQAARDQKIQIVRWVNNPLRDIFSITQLRFFQASSGSGSSKTSISVPGLPQTLMKDILRYYFGRNIGNIGANEYGIDRSFLIRRSLYLVLVPAIILLSVGIITQTFSWWYFSVFWLVAGFFYQFHLHRKWRYYLQEDGVLTVSGVVERVHKALLLRKVQGVQIKQSPYQWRNGLATVIFHSASGDLQIPYIRMDLALRIKNYTLYKVESSRQKWM
ncbi:MAG: PH domain-containing protein [Saprospiraceae bacterium]|nr:PH domain-containing protein [Saprospiraceae bacterium]